MMPHHIEQDTWKQEAGTAAAGLIEDGMVIGLGTGSTAGYLIYALAQRIASGLNIVGAVSSSNATRELAGNLNIPLTNLDAHPELDLYIDGADEIDPQLRLLKGAGGALLREKIVASCARRFVVVADITKQVTQLGHKSPVPVEVVPLAVTPVSKRIATLGANVQLRMLADQPFLTDNQNFIVDCTFPAGITNPEELDARLHAIVGVVETGLFLHMARQAFIGGPNGVQTIP